MRLRGSLVLLAGTIAAVMPGGTRATPRMSGRTQTVARAVNWPLHKFNPGSGVFSSPSAYAVNGEQFVAVADGGAAISS